jgi:hypothetical protein
MLTTFIIIFVSISYGMMIVILYPPLISEEDWDSCSIKNKIGRLMITFLPINILFGLFAILYLFVYEPLLEDKIDSIFRKYKSKRILKSKIKDRERKIKLGFIKISDIDPYGEEDWEV